MRPAADASPSVALEGPESATSNASSASSCRSRTIDTSTERCVSPAGKDNVPLVAMKSPGLAAVPFVVAKPTVTGNALGPDSVTGNATVPRPPSPSIVSVSAIASETGASSSTIVPTAVPSAMTAFVGLPRFSVNVSSGSSIPSPTTGTITVRTPTPGGKVSMPAAAV